MDTVARIIQAAERWDSPMGQLKGRCLEYILTNYEVCFAHRLSTHDDDEEDDEDSR